MAASSPDQNTGAVIPKLLVHFIKITIIHALKVSLIIIQFGLMLFQVIYNHGRWNLVRSEVAKENFNGTKRKWFSFGNFSKLLNLEYR